MRKKKLLIKNSNTPNTEFVEDSMSNRLALSKIMIQFEDKQ